MSIDEEQDDLELEIVSNHGSIEWNAETGTTWSIQAFRIESKLSKIIETDRGNPDEAELMTPRKYDRNHHVFPAPSVQS